MVYEMRRRILILAIAFAPLFAIAYVRDAKRIAQRRLQRIQDAQECVRKTNDPEWCARVLPPRDRGVP